MGNDEPLSADILEIPAHLKRERTPEARARADAVVREVLNQQRTWVMPSREAKLVGEEDVAKNEKMLVEDESKPIEAYRYGEEEPFHKFENLADFEAWYKPSKHRYLGSTTTPELTTVMFDVGNHAPLPNGKEAGKPKKKQGERQAPHTKWYIVNSHIGLILKQKGFLRITTPDDEPLAFKHKDGREVIILPPDKKMKSSSDWLIRLPNGKGEKGRGVSIKEKL